jgi:hypothetical protein
MAAYTAKDAQRLDYDRLTREVIRRIQAQDRVADTQPSASGITARDVESTPTPAPDHATGGQGRFF